MADQDIDDVIATTDGDTTWGDDMRGAITTIKDNLVAGRANVGVSGTRLGTGVRKTITMGPAATFGSALTDCTKGSYVLGLSVVAGGTPTTVSIRVITASSGNNFYYVIYNIDDVGAPTTVHASWGPFSLTSTGAVALTSQTTPITRGTYLVGGFFPTANSGVGAIQGFTPGLMLPHSVAATPRTVMVTADSGHSTPQDLSSFTIDGYTSTQFANTQSVIPILYGES